ncbi:hypothetical protein lbkm_0621 [Lachnospiraceae bacterium KM106-2]|nr:hypothetical protein lbkm_0621 [Lachnospiraceae bacterium KM106-2]
MACATEKDTTKASTDDEREKMREKMETSIKKWNSLKTADKEKVYKILEEREAADQKLLDQLVTLGVMDQKDVSEIKMHRKEMMDDLKKSGMFPLVGQKRHRGSCDCQKEKREE